LYSAQRAQLTIGRVVLSPYGAGGTALGLSLAVVYEASLLILIYVRTFKAIMQRDIVSHHWSSDDTFNLSAYLSEANYAMQIALKVSFCIRSWMSKNFLMPYSENTELLPIDYSKRKITRLQSLLNNCTFAFFIRNAHGRR